MIEKEGYPEIHSGFYKKYDLLESGSEVIKLNPGIIDPYLLIVTPILLRIVPPMCH